MIRASESQMRETYDPPKNMLLTDPAQAHNMRALSKCIISVVLVHT